MGHVWFSALLRTLVPWGTHLLGLHTGTVVTGKGREVFQLEMALGNRKGSSFLYGLTVGPA